MPVAQATSTLVALRERSWRHHRKARPRARAAQPVSYFTAARFGAVEIGTPGLIAVAVEYAILVPILLVVAHGVAVLKRSAA